MLSRSLDILCFTICSYTNFLHVHLHKLTVSIRYIVDKMYRVMMRYPKVMKVAIVCGQHLTLQK